MDFNEHASAMLKLWTDAQRAMFDSAVASVAKTAAGGRDAGPAAGKSAPAAPRDTAGASPAADPASLWMAGSRQFFDAFSRSFGMPPGAPSSVGSASASPTAGKSADPLAGIQALWQSSQGMWREFAKATLTPDSPAEAVAEQTFRKLLDPATWMSGDADAFDLGVERLTEGPAFASLWDMDRKLARLAESRIELEQASAHYHAQVLQCWTRAYQAFLESLAARGPGEQPGGWRAMLDAWSETANAELIGLHRSEAFLGAQRAFIRCAMEYRLREREVAETCCEAYHIPTRTEVDELQKAVYELRRELRAQRRAAKPGKPAPEAPARPARKRTAKKKPRARKKPEQPTG